jgi:hypothetical protein
MIINFHHHLHHHFLRIHHNHYIILFLHFLHSHRHHFPHHMDLFRNNYLTHFNFLGIQYFNFNYFSDFWECFDHYQIFCVFN